MGSQPDLHVVIVGGGIAGLTAVSLLSYLSCTGLINQAFALRHPNRRITILERSRMLREAGALLSLQPNASKIIDNWDLFPFLQSAEPLVDGAFRIFNTNGDCVREIKLEKEQFGADRLLYHRQDLQSALKDAAISDKAYGNPAEIRTACQVTSVDCDEGIVTLESGEKIHGDIIIGADGIHSAVRTAVLGEERHAQPTGLSAYRMLVPTERLANVSSPDKLIDIKDPSTAMIMGSDKRVIMGPGRGSKLYGIVAIVPDGSLFEDSSGDSWVQAGSHEKLLEAYADFPTWLHDIFKAAPDVALWQLRDMDPLSRWVRGRTILIGDAAHAMLPTQGQGASQSFEDVEALQAFLQNVESRDDVNTALERVFSVRYDRATLIQKFSREQARPATDGRSKKIKLDPAQFMRYNCDYEGAVNWEDRQKKGAAEP